mmetsp:Transcript_35089/g.99514  ORF Transcript_35089/g.99514 Transcript_35089/m.99514 type:complete len:348 (-) Transcript_35089:159-1202(-)|eukprot:CAMPEP_0117677924 /NCGR_PEP_ID=MMETSP0804-20121206/17003_1 /TAXON_ID=1074897 /ORGANISM="Tetraselmis astigmatica, Strain CCMP880" /LENGTH=347 /DNA_ID=CAMNT_0005487237 /DNA_START=103 /DNA_END=1146 /DNA_ORIENTATION=-
MRHSLVRSIALMLAAMALAAPASSTIEERLLGWKGESHHVGAEAEAAQALQREASPIEVVSWEPRAFVYHGFLSGEECEHLINLAKPRITRSGVVNTETGGSHLDKVRTSSGMFFRRGETEVIKGIEQKIAAWTLINEDQGEGIQVLKYEPTQKYDKHYDYFFHDQANDNGGNRMATVLMYLSDVESGGETAFPLADKSEDQLQHPERYSECGLNGLSVKPRKGDALLFFSLQTTGELERKSIHAGCPVISGEKWSATKWIHVAALGKGKVEHKVFAPPPPPLPPGCEDKNKQCRSWAMQGECDINPTYMLGNGKDTEGACLASCNACHLMFSRAAAASSHEEIRRA